MKPKLFDEFGNSIKYPNVNPSLNFQDESKLLSKEKRIKIIDLAGELVFPQNHFLVLGRAAMCLQFAILVKYMLSKEGIPSNIYSGDVKYIGGEGYQWGHYWVETNDEIIDCNVDSMIYHPDVPEGVKPINYWGSIARLPNDRKILSRSIYDDKKIEILEKEDNETIEWKKKIDERY